MADLALNIVGGVAGNVTSDIKALGSLIEGIGTKLGVLHATKTEPKIGVNTTEAETGLSGLLARMPGYGSGMATGLSGGFSAAAATMGVAALAVGAVVVKGLEEAMSHQTATAQLQAQLGVTAEVAGKYGEMAGQMYSKNFGDSFAGVEQALVTVKQTLSSTFITSDPMLQAFTETVLRVSAAFGTELQPTVAAVDVMLRNNLAPDAATALDIITKGMQQGDNKAGDLFSTLSKGSPQFAQMGLDGQTSMGIISQALEGGAKNTDAVVMAFQKLHKNIVDPSKKSIEALQSLGLNAGQMGRDIAAGGEPARLALDKIFDGLRNMTDPVARDRAEVDLFGAKSAALGDALLHIDPSAAAAKLGDFAGSAKKASDAIGDTAQSRITAFTRSLQEGIVNFITAKVLPAFESFVASSKAMFDNFANNSPILGQLGAAFTAIFDAIGPLIVAFGSTLGAALKLVAPVISAVLETVKLLGPALQFLAGPLGVAAGAFVALKVAGMGIGVLQGIITGIGTAAATAGMNAGVMAEKFTGSTNAGMKLATAGETVSSGLTKVSNTLPLIGAALVVVGIGYDAVRDKSADMAANVLSGSQTWLAATDKESAAMKTQGNLAAWLAPLVSQGRITVEQASSAEFAHAAAVDTVNKSMREQAAALGPVQLATANVTIAEGELQAAYRTSSSTSGQVQTATNNLNEAKKVLTDTEKKQADALRWTTDAMTAQTNAAAGAAGADLNLQTAQIHTTEAIQNATIVLQNHTTASNEGKTAIIGVTTAALAEAQAAGDKAAADGKAAGATDVARLASDAYTDRLIALASQASGPTRDALLTLIGHLDTTRSGANKAALEAAGLTTEIDKIPGSHVTAITTPGLPDAMSGIRNLGTTIQGLVDRNVSIFVNAIGSGALAGATLGRASGGILPGFTPGVDVHRFVGAAGTLDLSGGEAIMRPEWTQAMGSDYVNRANAAARSGGTAAVRRLAAEGDNFADGGIYGAFANGGVVGTASFKQDMSGFDAQMRAYEAIAQAYGVIAWMARKVAASVAGMVSGTAPAAAGGNVGLVQSMAAGRGWTGSQWDALYAVVMRESGFNNNAQNPSSTAYGMFQFLDSTWAAYGASKTSDPAAQTTAGLNYIASRYGTPQGALAHEQQFGWYGDGGIVDRPTFGMLGESGREVVLPLSKPQRAADLLTSVGMGGGSSAGIESRLDRLLVMLEQNGAGATIHVNDTSGDPQQTARSTVLQLRMR